MPLAYSNNEIKLISIDFFLVTCSGPHDSLHWCHQDSTAYPAWTAENADFAGLYVFIYVFRVPNFIGAVLER